jgi:outer membrane protein insertion porin family
MLNKKNFINLLIIINIIFFSLSLKAEIINSVSINGNNRVSDETILIYGKIKNNTDITDKELNKIITNLNSTNFFEEIDVQVKNNKLIINLIEYPLINQIIINGEKSNKIKKELLKNLQLKEKQSFIKSYLSSDIEILKNLYSSLGYNFVEIDTKVNQLDASNYDLLINIQRGEKTKISSIKFTGDKKIRDKRLKDITASEEDKFWKFISRNTNFSQNLVNLDIRLMTNYYKSIGYYDVNIVSNSAELNDKNNVDLVYSINAGTRYTIDKITTTVDPTFDNKLFFSLKKSYDKLIGEYYSPFEIKKILDDIDELIDRNNLQFVEHNVEEVVGSNSISINFNIYEGEKNLVERINILGNNITDEAVIRGEILLDEGDPFTNINLDRSLANLKSRNIFKSVKSDVSKGSANNLKIIDINVEEKPTGEIAAGAGVGTNGGSFEFTISENNWLGEGKKLDFNLASDSESLSGTISYSDPNYNFLGNAINYYVTSKENDKPDSGYENSIVAAGIGTSFEQYKNIYTNLGLSASYDDLRTLDTASENLKKQSGNFSDLTGEYGIKYDTRNRSFRPTEGSIIYFNQSLPIYADKQSISNSFSLSKYKAFTETATLGSKFLISTITGVGDDDVRLSKRKNLSTRRLRGFEKNKIGPVDGTDHIGGNYTAAVNLELSLPKLLPSTSNADIGLFLDAGNVWGVDYDSSIDDSNKIRSSLGAALNWSSPIGPLSFTMSQNLSKAKTDKTESFNFNLGTTF